MESKATRVLSEEASVVLCGAAGQGVQTIEKLLPRLLKHAGYHVCTTKEYMSRIRGGSNSTEIRVTGRRVDAYVRGVDLLIPLDGDALRHMEPRIADDTLVIGDPERLETERETVGVPFGAWAREIGDAIFENILATGVVAGIFALDLEESAAFIDRFFSGKGEDLRRGNSEAFARGHARGLALVEEGVVEARIDRSEGLREEMLLNGSEAVALGAVAGGCDFIAAYPMTPSTGVFSYLAQHASELGIVAEQAEDEIAAVNMSLGAWYAGARAMVTTSGGGFALMAEGLSLAGMLESPAVIFLSQRPGPATGLPTRTEQGDLNFALWAGHGEFPRAILAPGSLEEAFDLTRRSFDLADRYQVPVIVLADQFLVDLQHSLPPFDISRLETPRHIVETGDGYRRYAPGEGGISPRGVPGHGTGLVGLDSDEHDEEGHITEDLALRKRMVDKRMAKLGLLAGAALPPRLHGGEDFHTLVVGWGSTSGVIREAVERIGDGGLACLHVSQVYPLHADVGRLMARARRTVVVENNATGQFASLLRLLAGRGADASILQYDGMPFAVEDLAERLSREAGR